MYAIFFLGIVRDQWRLAVMTWPVKTWYKGSRNGCQALANRAGSMAESRCSRNWPWEVKKGGREGGEDGLRGKGWGKEATLKAMGETRTQPRRPH